MQCTLCNVQCARLFISLYKFSTFIFSIFFFLLLFPLYSEWIRMNILLQMATYCRHGAITQCNFYWGLFTMSVDIVSCPIKSSIVWHMLFKAFQFNTFLLLTSNMENVVWEVQKKKVQKRKRTRGKAKKKTSINKTVYWFKNNAKKFTSNQSCSFKYT